MNVHASIDAATATNGAVIAIPLNRLKASPKNARKTPHAEAAIEALAASIAVKDMLQKPVVEPEIDAAGLPTGFWLVTIGEGRRQALLLRVRRKEIAKTAPVSCVVDLANDPYEISLDENVTRSAMHPADQFEAFRDLSERRGWGAEEIGARFGVSAHVVRQRLRLGAISPRLMAVYRQDGLTLDQLMAFALSEDHARQEQVFDQLTWNKAPHTIRRAMTETKLAASDRRAIFVGAEAYGEAGGSILRDLFTEDDGGWFEDVGLLDRLVLEKLAALATETLEREGWKWARAEIDFPHGHGLRRVYPQPVQRAPKDEAAMAALAEDYDALVSQWDSVEDLPAEAEARFKAIDAALEAYGDSHAYGPDDIARGGLIVVLGHNGQARVERGFIRPQDEAAKPEAEPETETGDGSAPGEVEGDAQAGEDEAEGGLGPLPERLAQDLTAHRTAALRDALADTPSLALVAVAHALAARSFYPGHDQPTCLDLKLISANLEGHAPGVGESPAGRRMAERHEAWAQRLPRDSAQAWAFVISLDGTDLLALIAHCAGLSVNAVRDPLDRRPAALAHAEALAGAASLDMTTTWSATAASYLGRVTKARILEAVGEAVSSEAALRIGGLKKPDMAAAAEGLLAGTGWLPPLLRTAAHDLPVPVAAA